MSFPSGGWGQKKEGHRNQRGGGGRRGRRKWQTRKEEKFSSRWDPQIFSVLIELHATPTRVQVQERLQDEGMQLPQGWSLLHIPLSLSSQQVF